MEDVAASPVTRIGGFLVGRDRIPGRAHASAGHVFDLGALEMETGAIHTVKPFSVRIPRGRMTAGCGVSGSGKTTLVLESLVPALQAQLHGGELPTHVASLDADGIERANLIDATPIGVNVRSTVGTYSGVLDELRRAFAALPDAKAAGLKAGAFSYNTGSLRCPTCDGTGQISLDVQFLPDVDIPCPDCRGSRYAEEAYGIRLPVNPPEGDESLDELSLPEIMALTVDELLERLDGPKRALSKLRVLHDLGLGYLTLGEATPALSGGEAQRLKLASEIGRDQSQALFVFDEPTIGLHPLDVQVLIDVLQRLLDAGATIVVIEHDLDIIENADWVIDLGPGGGEAGGRIVACGTPEEVAANPDSVTGRYMRI